VECHREPLSLPPSSSHKKPRLPSSRPPRLSPPRARPRPPPTGPIEWPGCALARRVVGGVRWGRRQGESEAQRRGGRRGRQKKSRPLSVFSLEDPFPTPRRDPKPCSQPSARCGLGTIRVQPAAWLYSLRSGGPQNARARAGKSFRPIGKGKKSESDTLSLSRPSPLLAAHLSAPHPPNIARTLSHPCTNRPSPKQIPRHAADEAPRPFPPPSHTHTPRPAPPPRARRRHPCPPLDHAPPFPERVGPPLLSDTQPKRQLRLPHPPGSAPCPTTQAREREKTHTRREEKAHQDGTKKALRDLTVPFFVLAIFLHTLHERARRPPVESKSETAPPDSRNFPSGLLLSRAPRAAFLLPHQRAD
jgi:hypothetical protein